MSAILGWIRSSLMRATTRTLLLLAVGGVALPGDAQIVTRDSTLADTAAAVPVHGDLRGEAGRRSPQALMDTLLPAALLKRKNGWHGRVELGGTHGPIPYSLAAPNAWNAFTQGQLDLDLLGFPLQARFDLGTDVPVRGQRNSIRLTFDKDRLVQRVRWADTHGLSTQRALVDSLERVRSTCYRQWRATTARSGAIGTDRPVVPDTILPAGGASPDLPDGRSPRVDAWAVPSPRDSLGREGAALRARLDALDAAIAEARQKEQRLGALVNAGNDKDGFLRHVLSGLQRLDIGSCAPTSSEFLINGIDLQGISLAYAQHDVYVSLDHGRSFDDAWRNSDATTRRLDRLQQSLFLADTRDLNPRKLTAVRVGFGDPERSHVHIGYLRGEREGLPPGYFGPAAMSGTQRNQVIEADLGLEIRRHHLLRFVLARSSLTQADDPEGPGNNGVGGLFQRGEGQDQAMKLIWSSRLEKWGGASIDVEGRSIAPFFQSFGMGYVRNGSRAGEVRASRSFGKRWKLRGRYGLDERTPPGEATRCTIHRTQMQATYRPLSVLALRASCMPVTTRTEAADAVLTSRSGAWSIGGDLRHRWGRTTALFNADITRYAWAASGMTGREALNYAVGSSLLWSDRLQVSVGWSALVITADTAATPTGNASARIMYRSAKKLDVEAGAQVPAAGHAGWMVTARKPIAEGFLLSMRMQSFSRSDLFFQEGQVDEEKEQYTWMISIIHQW